MTNLDTFDDIHFLREDLNPTGSAKDRAIPFQIENLIKTGYTSAVISSTGNAAISAQYYCQQKNIDLTVFVSPHTSPQKLSIIKNYRFSPQPISDAFKFSKASHSYFLRQSTDPTALTGYSTITTDILNLLPTVTSIFLPIGSGTTLLGIAQNLPPTIKLFGAQSAYNCPIGKIYQPNYQPESNNLTDSLTVKYLPLKQLIQKSIADCFVVTNSDILKYQKILQGYHLNCSNEGGLSLASYYLAKQKYNVGEHPLIIITGTKR